MGAQIIATLRTKADNFSPYDTPSDSAVYTPENKAEWENAKLNVQVTDFLQGQIVEHLLKGHFITELVCVSIKRQLAAIHPLRQIMNIHCASVFVPNTFGVPLLLDPHTGLLRLLFAAGSKGAERLLDEGYQSITWDSLDFNQGLKVQTQVLN